MNNFDRINLEKMIKTNNVEDCTQEIRNKNHSNLIKKDLDILLNLKKQYSRLAKSNPQEFDQICVNRCQFIFNNYTDIYNKVKKDEIDLAILYKFLEVLKEIEDGKVDQHEGSFKVGKLLKDMYIDSAVKKAEKLDKHKSEKVSKKPKKISYKDYKILQEKE
jgi:hypothetical protein